MTAARIRQAQRQSHSGEVRVQALHLTGLKIEIHRAIHGARKLVHQAGGFSKMPVFRLLAKLRERVRVQRTAVAERVENAAEQDLKRR